MYSFSLFCNKYKFRLKTHLLHAYYLPVPVDQESRHSLPGPSVRLQSSCQPGPGSHPSGETQLQKSFHPGSISCCLNLLSVADLHGSLLLQRLARERKTHRMSPQQDRSFYILQHNVKSDIPLLKSINFSNVLDGEVKMINFIK